MGGLELHLALPVGRQDLVAWGLDEMGQIVAEVKVGDC